MLWISNLRSLEATANLLPLQQAGFYLFFFAIKILCQHFTFFAKLSMKIVKNAYTFYFFDYKLSINI